MVGFQAAEKVLEHTLGIPNVELGGPTYFWIMMNLLMSMTEDGVRAMTKKIRLMDNKKIIGENIDEAVGLLLVGIGHLRNLNKLSYNLDKQLLTIFQMTSVDAFNNIFKFTYINVRMGIVKVNADYLLDTALKAYKEMLALGT
jgi:hypothetical protein